MFSVKQKREIADAVQQILQATNHPELPASEIQSLLHVDGAESWSWADIRNNGAVQQPGINTWNELQDSSTGVSELEGATTPAPQPEPEGPTDEELISPIMWMIDECVYDKGEIAQILRELITRWGRPAIEPVPVAERLPGPDELDDQGTCWMFHPVNLHYCLCRPDPSVHTHWLPHWALPLPTPLEMNP